MGPQPTVEGPYLRKGDCVALLPSRTGPFFLQIAGAPVLEPVSHSVQPHSLLAPSKAWLGPVSGKVAAPAAGLDPAKPALSCRDCLNYVNNNSN